MRQFAITVFILSVFCVPVFAGRLMVVNRQIALNAALANNPSYLASIEDTQSARYAHRADWAEFLPGVTFSASTYDSKKDDGNYITSESASFSANYNLFNGFRSYYTFRSSGLNYDIMSKAEKDKLLQTIKDVNLAYQRVLRADFLRKASRTSYESASLVLDESELRLRLDLISRADLYSARADRERAYSSLLDAETSYKTAILELVELTGLDIDSTTEFIDEERTYSLGEDASYYLELALENNAQLIQSTLNMDLARYKYRSSYGNFLPSIDFTASQSWYDNDDTGRYDSKQFGLSATWSLFSGFGDTHTVISNAKNLNSAQHKVSENRNSLIRQVNTTYMNASGSFEKVSSSRAFVSAAQENYTAMQEMYRLGRSSLRDTIDARKTLEDAQVSLAEANYSMAEAFETLAVLIGRNMMELE